MALATYSDFQTRTANGRNTMAWSNTQDRTAPFPLEKYSIFPDYATACAYAAGEGEYEGLPYEGQIISVTENGKQVVYALDRNATNYLRKVASDVDPETLVPSDIGAADAEHTHEISDVTGLQEALDDKADDEHTHAIADVTGLQNALDDKANDGHEHEITDVKNLKKRLDDMASAIAGGGGSGGGDSTVPYTVNGTFADENGNFTVDPAVIGAAEVEHTHEISEVVNLTETLANKAAIDHTHTMVSSLDVNGNALTGDVQLKGSGNVRITQVSNTIDVSITPYLSDTTDTIREMSTNTQYKVFIGTEHEWLEFKQTLPENSHYLVFIRS